MKSFLEVVEEIKKSFDQDDASILATIEDSLETDLTAASIRHLAGTFFVYNKKVYKAIQLIPVGDPIVIGTAGTPGVNAVLAEDIMSLIAGIGDSKFGDFAAVTDVTVDGVIYHTYWKVAPTNSNQVSGLAVHPTTGQLCEVYNNQGTYSLTSFTTEIQALTNQEQATRDSIAPTEDGINYSTTYYAGDKFYRDGKLYEVTASSVNNSIAINTGSGGNATLSSKVETQILDLSKSMKDMPAFRNVFYGYQDTYYSPYPAIRCSGYASYLVFLTRQNSGTELCAIWVQADTITVTKINGTDIHTLIHIDILTRDDKKYLAFRQSSANQAVITVQIIGLDLANYDIGTEYIYN